MKNFINTKAVPFLKRNSITLAACAVAFLCCVSKVFCEDEIVVTIIEAIADFYHKWSPILIVIDIILLVITKDDKKKQIEKNALIGLCIVFVLLYVAKDLPGKLETWGAKLSGTAATTAEVGTD